MTDSQDLADEPLRWFPHDADAAGDPKCRRLMRKTGAAGYGRWWLLCEALASEPGHRIRVKTTTDLENLAVLLDLDCAEEATEFIEDLLAVGLLTSNDGFVSSPRMDANAERSGKSKERSRRAAIARWSGQK